MTDNYNPELQRNYNRDMERRGFGCASTVWRKVRAGRIPQPICDEAGRPYWTDAMLLKHQEELILRKSEGTAA